VGFDIERYLRIRSAVSPSFSPDGKKIAYITETTGVPQVWTVDLQDPWPEQVTFFSERVSGARYSPTSPEIIFSIDSGGNERMQIFRVSQDGSWHEDLTRDPGVIHSFGGWDPFGERIAFSSNKRNSRFFDVYVMHMKTGETAMVYQEDGTNHVACWTPDGGGLIIRRSNSNMDQDLFYLDLGRRVSRHLTPHTGEASFHSVKPDPSGKRFYLVTDLGREFSALAALDLEGRIEFLKTPQWDVEALDVTRDGRFLAYTVNSGGYSDLWIMDLASDEVITLPGLPRGVIGNITWDPSGRRLAFVFSGPAYNPDVWLFDMDDMKVSQVTRSSRAGIPQSSFVEPEPVEYPTFDGRKIPAFFYKPRGETGELPSSSRRLPVIVYVHGGPESQARPSFNAVIQYFLSRGYAVFLPNVRGSAGYGRQYVHLDDVRKRMDSVKDLAWGVQWLKSRSEVDPGKIAVMGGSYGGFMVLASITAYPDLWAAGVDIVGIANLETFLRNTGPWRRHLREKEYGSLENDLEFFREISPIYHVDRIRCPLMVVHGKNDPRVPFGEAEQIVEKVKAQGGVVEPLFFEDEGHGVVKLQNRLLAYRRIADFLDRYVAGRK